LKFRFIDTENGPYDLAKFQKRVYKMTGQKMGFYSTGSLFEDGVLAVIEKVSKAFPQDVLIVDNLQDATLDFNDPVTSKAIIKLCQAHAKGGGAVIGVMHDNPGKGDQKPQGHLGTWGQKKSTLWLQTVRGETRQDWYQVAVKKERGVEVVSFKMRVAFDMPELSVDGGPGAPQLYVQHASLEDACRAIYNTGLHAGKSASLNSFYDTVKAFLGGNMPWSRETVRHYRDRCLYLVDGPRGLVWGNPGQLVEDF
jgi:hypothetical protein